MSLIAALEAGKIDDRDDTTFNWMAMAVDRLGWTQVAEVLDEALVRLQSVYEQCRGRLAMTGEETTQMIVGLAAFEAVAFVEDPKEDSADDAEAEPDASS